MKRLSVRVEGVVRHARIVEDEIVLDDSVGHQGGAGYGCEYLSGDQMMANLLRESQNCMKNRLIFGFNAHMIAVKEILDR